MALREKYRPKGVLFLAVAVQGSEPQVEATAEELGFDWTLAWPESDVMGAVGTWTMPTTVWIDAQGHIARVEPGMQSPEDLDRWTAEIVSR